MLKRWYFAALPAVWLFASPALAADTGPGCGLGTMIFEGNKKIVHQVLAATTNGTFGNQTFGITSGTLGCTNDGLVKNEEKVRVFAAVNLDNLSEDMAQGEGEYLTSLAVLLGIPAEQHSSFFDLTRSRFNTLFPSEDTSSETMLASLRMELAKADLIFIN